MLAGVVVAVVVIIVVLIVTLVYHRRPEGRGYVCSDLYTWC